MAGRATGGGSSRGERRPSPAPASRPSPSSGDGGHGDRLRELGPVVAVLALALVVLAGLAVLPARTWWAQRRNMNDAHNELVQVESEVAQLKADLELLQTDTEVERLARRDFDLVFPGEESYRLVPPPAAPVLGSEPLDGPAAEPPGGPGPGAG